MSEVFLPLCSKKLNILDGCDYVAESLKEQDEFLRFYAKDDPATRPIVAPINFLKVYKRHLNPLLLPLIPWEQVLPKSFIEIYEDNFKIWWLNQKFPKETKQFKESYKAQNIIYDNLVPLTIDKNLFENFKQENKNESFNLFDPSKPIEIIKYNRKTTTGRMIVTSGPNVLVLAKEYRKMFKANNGRLLYADFKSLEPNVLLFVTGRNTTKTFYENLMTALKIQDRNVMKQGYLATIYGAGIEKIASIFNVSEYKAETIAKELNHQLGVSDLREKLVQEWYDNSKRFITNFFGQRIRTPLNETPEYKLLSLYLQSTATEMAIRMFARANELFIKNNLITRFSAIIHDGAYMDSTDKEFVAVRDILDEVTIFFDKNRPFFITLE